MRGLQRLSGLGPLCERLLSGSQLPTLSAAGEIAFRGVTAVCCCSYATAR